MDNDNGAKKGNKWRTCWWIVGGAILVLIAMAVVLPIFRRAREKARSPDFRMTKAPAMQPVAEMAAPTEEAQASGGSALTDLLTSTAYAANLARQIIYRADFTIEVKNVDSAAGEIERVAKEAGGWVSGKTTQEYVPGKRTCEITVRVPVDKFVDTCEVIRKLGEVLSEGLETDDVTEEFVDLDARLRNLHREEEVLLGLFKRGGKISDVLQVERELSRVRGEIEQLQGRLRYLKDRVNYSTISVSLHTEHAETARKMDKWDLGYHVLRAWRALVTAARVFTYIVIYTVIVAGPFAVLAWVIWRIWKAISSRRRRSGVQASSSAADEE